MMETGGVYRKEGESVVINGLEVESERGGHQKCCRTPFRDSKNGAMLVLVDFGPGKSDSLPIEKGVLNLLYFTQSVGKKGLETLRIEGGEIHPDMEIQFFDKGDWTSAGRVDARKTLSEQKAAFESLPYGKFRLKANLTGSSLFQYSNEFYFKRI